MIESKLVNLLRKMDTRQRSRASEWVSGPFVNKSKEILILFEYLNQHGPEFVHPNLEKDKCLQYLQNHFPADEKKLAKWMSQCLQILEQFLVWESLSGDLHQYNLILAKIYRHLELPTHEEAALRKLQRPLNQQPEKNAAYLQNLFELEMHRYEASDPNLRAYNIHLQQAADALDKSYLAKKLWLVCEMLNFQKTLNLEYELNFPAPLVRLITNHPIAREPVIEVYLKAYALLQKTDDPDAFEALKILLARQEHLFSQQEIRFMYGLLLNFCTRRVVRLHDHTFEREYLNINRYLLEKNWLLENGQISPWRYSNLVTIGLRLGEIEWVKNFIENFKDDLPPEHAQNLYLYKTGQLLFHEGKLGEAQATLLQVELKDPFLALSVKNLLVKIYYETDAGELLFSYLEAYRIYVLRHEMMKDAVKKQVQNFIDTTRKLAKIPSFEKEKLYQLAANFPPERETLHHDWLQTQLQKKIKA